MKMSDEARQKLDRKIDSIIRKIEVHDSDSAEIKKELTSHFFDKAAEKAKARGSDTIETNDMEAVFLGMESPEELAAEYMKSYADTFARAGIVSRTIAYIIDLALALLFVLILIVIFVIPLVILGILKFVPTGVPRDLLWKISTDSVFLDSGLSFFISAIIIVALVIYFVVLEARFGYTLGKWIMGLRVLRTDGSRIGYKEAIIRNIPKFFSNFVVIDAILMLCLDYFVAKRRQRGFDIIAGTMVIHTRRKK